MQTELLERMMTVEPKTQSVKLRINVIRGARIIVAHGGGETMTDLLSDILEPVITKRVEEIRESWARSPKGKGGLK